VAGHAVQHAVRPVRRPLSRRGRWRRTIAARVISALLAGTALWLVASAVLPRAPDPGVPVLVATRDVGLGETVSAADVRVDRRPEAYRPSGALSSADPAVGRVLSGPVMAGEVLTPARFRGAGSLTGLPDGSVVVSVPVGDTGLAATLHPADLVSVLVAGSGETVAASAPVLSADLTSASVIGASGPAGAHLLLALTPAEAKAYAAAVGAPTSTGFVIALHR
jgi:Flp pilus assembly protein CpaB